MDGKRLLLALAACIAGMAQLRAEEPQRHAERTPYPKIPIVQSMERAGNPTCVAWWAKPSIGNHEAGGYVGGGSIKGNKPFSKTEGGLGPIQCGTFGWDYVGFCDRTGRIFLGNSPEKHKETCFYRGYRTDGPEVKDVFAIRPIRKAVLECKEENPKHNHGGKE